MKATLLILSCLAVSFATPLPMIHVHRRQYDQLTQAPDSVQGDNEIMMSLEQFRQERRKEELLKKGYNEKEFEKEIEREYPEYVDFIKNQEFRND